MNSEKSAYRVRKPRTSRACEVCHDRKVRCDANIRVPCTSCQTFGLVCRLRDVKKVKRGKKVGGAAGGAEAGLKAEDDAEVGAHPSAGAEGCAPGHGHGPGQGAGQGRENEEEQTVKETVSNGMPYGDEYLRGRGVEPGVFFDAEREDRDRVYVYFGSSSFLSMLTGSSFPDGSNFASAQKLRSALPLSGEGSPRVANLEMLRITGAFLLPSKQICDELVDLYFRYIHPLMPIMNQTEFRKAYAANTCSIFLLQAILCVAVKLSRNPLLMDKNGSTDLASNIFYQRAKSLYDGRYEENEVCLLQGMMLLSKQAFNEKNTIHMPMYFIKNAVTIAQTYGLHRSADFHPTLTANEKRARKLIWWILYVIDTLVSISIGRPQAINLDDCDVPVLTHDDFVFEGEAPEHSMPVDHMDCIISTVQIAEIMSRISRELNRPAAAHCDAKFLIQHFDLLLQRWRNNLPESLTYHSNAEIFTKHSIPKAFVNALYYKTLCLLHKSNIHDMVRASDEQYLSAGIAFQAAHSLSLVGQILLDRDELGYCYAGHAYCFFEAMTIFVHHMYDSSSIFSEIALKCYHVLEQVLLKLGQQWNSCALLGEVLFSFSKKPEYIRSLVKSFKSKISNEKSPAIPIEVPSPARSIEIDRQRPSPTSVGSWSSPIQGINAVDNRSPNSAYKQLRYAARPVFPVIPKNPRIVSPSQHSPKNPNPQVPFIQAATNPQPPPIQGPPPPWAHDFNFTTTDLSQVGPHHKSFDPHQLFPDVSQPLPADFHFNSNLEAELDTAPGPLYEGVEDEDQTEPPSSTSENPPTDLVQSSGDKTPAQLAEIRDRQPVQKTSIPLPPGFWDSIQVNFNFFTPPENVNFQWPAADSRGSDDPRE